MKTKTILVALLSILVIDSLVFQSCNKDDETNKAPGCEITNPLNGEECKQNEIVTITAVATDSDGYIVEIKFFIDGENKGSVNSSPYSYEWNTSGATLGNHIIKATSFDNDGANTSAEISVEMLEGVKTPVVDFTATPKSGNVPLTVNFKDQSTNNPASWLWDFGDGNTSTEQDPSNIFNTMGSYNVTLTATNEFGPGTETKTNFIIASGNFSDPRDGQHYSTAEIGENTWFLENLNYESENSSWYGNSSENGDTYGRLYTWDAAMTSCPNGWRLPSDSDWKALEMALGMSQSQADGKFLRGSDEGKKLKSDNGWNLDGNGIDQVGFKALPGGMINDNGNSLYKGGYGAWWTSTKHEDQDWIKWYRYLESSEDKVGRNGYSKLVSFSVRCVKN